jgi:hypothetical protein
MNNNFRNIIQFPHTSTLFCVGERVFDKDWNELEVKIRKGWKYVVINRQQIGVSSLQERTGYSEPIYFNYVFGGGFMNGDNFYYDKLLRNK